MVRSAASSIAGFVLGWREQTISVCQCPILVFTVRSTRASVCTAACSAGMLACMLLPAMEARTLVECGVHLASSPLQPSTSLDAFSMHAGTIDGTTVCLEHPHTRANQI